MLRTIVILTPNFNPIIPRKKRISFRFARRSSGCEIFTREGKEMERNGAMVGY